jgi:4-amino-4-deoxy-L-arabinose transferase-like glycosyltransferase
MDAEDVIGRSSWAWWDSRWAIGSLLLATFLIRALHADQPLVENYVGRQVPTAMAARNLERGSGFLWPQLDTAPFPNYFLVEPPVYEACVVVIKRATGLSLTEAGRILSALAMALAAWGLYQLARPREGQRVALLAVAAFAVFPLGIRYGRAFQPDASMLGAVVAGLACWDRYRSRQHWPWLAAGWSLFAVGLALKFTAAFLLAPLLLVILRARGFRVVLAAFSTLMPACLWYAWAYHLLDVHDGSRASAQNQAIWLGVLWPSALLQAETLKIAGWSLLVRAFTPLGAGLALIGVWKAGRVDCDRDRLWWIWGISGLVTMALVAEKLHHEYYWLVVAPLAALGAGRALAWLAGISRRGAIGVTAALVLLCLWQARTTWRTPAEWADLEAAADSIKASVPPGAWVVAPEAVLFQADRRGCRLEWTQKAVERAAAEWPREEHVENPLELIAYYRRQGARYFADLGSLGADQRRKGLHDAIRRRYKVIVDRPDVVIADLSTPGVHWNAN